MNSVKGNKYLHVYLKDFEDNLMVSGAKMYIETGLLATKIENDKGITETETNNVYITFY